MVANARKQLDHVWQLDQVIVGAGGEGGALDLGVLLGRQHDDRHIAQAGRRTILGEQFDTVDAGHDQVLQDHRRLDLLSHAQRLMWVGAEVEVDVALFAQRPPHGFTDHGLVVDQQHHHRVVGQAVMMIGIPLRPLHKCVSAFVVVGCAAALAAGWRS